MLDQGIVVVYLIITLLVGLYVGRNTKTVEDYAIGARNFSTLALVSTIFASVVGADLTTALVSSIFDIGPIFLLAFLGIVLSNFGISFLIAPKMKPFLGLISSGEIFAKLYGKKAKVLMGLSIIIEITLVSAIQILAISQICNYFFSIPPVVGSIVVCFIILLYTFRGGIRSVTATDVFQFGIMTVAIPIMCSIAVTKAGGIYNVFAAIREYGLFFPHKTEQNINEYIAVFLSFSLPCLYPLCIQRMLMAKNTHQISSSFFINGILSLPFFLTIGIIGIVAYMLFPTAESNEVFSLMVDKILPIGAKGFVLAGMLAIFMSTVDSILNIGSLAIIHDVLGSINKSYIKPENEVRFMQLASLIIAISAIVICHLFSSIMDILFFLMVLGNSVFFPGFFWGILGFRASSFGFWLGVIAGISTVIICTFFLNIFPLTIMLIAICINSSILLFDYFLEKPAQKLWQGELSSNEHRFTLKNIRRNLFLNDIPPNQEYCTIFFICAVVISLFPFFFSATLGLEKFDPFLQIISLISCAISFFMIFRQQWWYYVDKLFPIIWLLSVTLVLPIQSFYMFLVSKFSFIWLLDSLLIIPLLYILNSNLALFLSILVGALISTVLFIFGNISLSQEIANDFGTWALVLHTFMLLICLALFRKKDQQAHHLTQKTLAHEANRSFCSFESTASYLNEVLPKLVKHFQLTSPIEAEKMNLQNILVLPDHLQSTATRSRYIIKKLTFFSGYDRPNKSVFNIIDSVKDAINEIAIKDKLSNKLEIVEEEKLLVNGDQNQITQVLINILENAIYGINNKIDAKIYIIISNKNIIIKDTGIGIKKTDLPNIFDEGFSTKETMGQGLFFCQRVIHNHAGSIVCHSEEGKFTEFVISFPKVNKG